MKIRALTRNDMKNTCELWTASGLPYKPTGRDHPDELAAYAEANPDLCLAAEIDCRIAGVVIGSDDGRKGWINRLAVHPDFQRRGVAGELIDSIEKNLRARGRRVFGSLILSRNDPSIALFESAGYSTMEEGVLYFRKADSDND